MGNSAPQQPDKNPQNPVISKLLPPIIVLSTTAGVSTAIITKWQTFFLEHPLWAIPLGITVIAIFIVTCSKRLQEMLDKFFITPSLDWIEIQLIRVFSHTWQRYRKAMFYSNVAFRLPTEFPLSLEFLKIFVKPRVKLNNKLKDVLPTPIAEQAFPTTNNTQTIDYFLTKKEFSQYNLIIILGSPGSGKTALLQYITLTLTKKKFSGANSKSRKLPSKIPILLSLPNHIADIQNKPTTFTIAHALQAEMHLKGMSHIPDLKWIKHHLDKGHCLVLLDGLDDIADTETHKQVIQWIKRSTISYRENRFLLTSRPQNYSGREKEDLTGVMVLPLEILPFDKSQIEHFVDKMCAAVIEKKPEFKTDPKELFQRLQAKPAIWDFAHNPLLLALSVSTYIEGNPLPEKRVALYQRICRDLLGKVKDELGVEDTAKQCERVLQLLSYTLMHEDQTGNIAIRDANKLKEIEDSIERIGITEINKNKGKILMQFLQMIYARTGLLERTGEEGSYLYQLFHSTVKEYLTAAYLHETKNDQVLINKIDKPEWKEIILLFCALRDASLIIHACLIKGTEQAIDLAFDCEKEALSINDQNIADALAFAHKQRETQP